MIFHGWQRYVLFLRKVHKKGELFRGLTQSLRLRPQFQPRSCNAAQGRYNSVNSENESMKKGNVGSNAHRN